MNHMLILRNAELFVSDCGFLFGHVAQRRPNVRRPGLGGSVTRNAKRCLGGNYGLRDFSTTVRS